MAIPAPQIIRSRRSSLTIHVGPDGKVLVKAPILVPNFVIKNFLKEKESWIEKTLEKIQQRKPTKKQYEEGEEFLFLGKTYKLKLHDAISTQLKGDFLLFPRAAFFRVQKELTSWYKEQAKQIITKRLNFHAKEMHAQYAEVFFSDTKSKWGTCFPDNSLQFNWRLVMAPLLVLDYVVIHELTHTTVKNHRDAFWRRVRLFTPAYKQHRKWLEEHAHLLMV